jgi:tetratricopeptide (TPR) repeat protein
MVTSQWPGVHDDDGMGGRRWARAVLAAAAALLLIALGVAGNRLDWWSAPEKPGEAAGGSLEWMEPVSWIASVLSFVVALYYARGQDAAAPPVVPLQVTLEVVQSTDAAVTASARAGAGLLAMSAHAPSSADGKGLINQKRARGELRAHLMAEESSVIAVYGRSGVGKSTLVASVIAEIGVDNRLFPLFGDDRLDVMSLVRAVESHPPSQHGLRHGESVLDRLEAALEASDGPPVTVVVDGVQHLLEPGTNRMQDLRLEEAFRKIAAGRRRAIKLVLIGDRAPELGRGNQPRFDPQPVLVNGLDAADLRIYVERAAGHNVDLSHVDWAQLHDVLDGIPRLGQLFYAALALPQKELTAHGLLRRLKARPPGDREVTLARTVVRSLADEQRRVAAGLAAFRTPVEASLLQNLVGEELPGSMRQRLDQLVDAHVVGKTNDRYHLINDEVLAALDVTPGRADDLLERAADVLSRRSGPPEHAESTRDFEYWFARIDIWCRAGRWLTAFDLIDSLDPLLRPIPAAELLLKPRELVANHLESTGDKAANYNAIGTIHLARGNLDKARTAFRNALDEVAGSCLPVEYERKIRLNVADLAWQEGAFGHAQDIFQTALDMVPTSGQDREDRLDRIAALSGLADCERHWGAHRKAIRLGTLAWTAASTEQSRQAVRVAIRLARWHSELGEAGTATELMDEAEKAVAQYAHGDAALRAQCLDGRADLALDAGDLHRAARLAADAVTTALSAHAPNTVLQARTTLAMAHLRLSDKDDTHLAVARKAVEEALPYRRTNRSLIVLSLRALIAFRQDPDGHAATYFADLQNESAERRREKRDVAAWEFEGLARAAAHALHRAPVDPAVAAFRQARALSPAPEILRERLAYQLQSLATRMPAESMRILVDSATHPNGARKAP